MSACKFYRNTVAYLLVRNDHPQAQKVIYKMHSSGDYVYEMPLAQWDALEDAPERCRRGIHKPEAHLALMKTTAGDEYYVRVSYQDRHLDIWSHKIEGRAEYGIDCLNWLLGNRKGPQPKVWEYKDV